MKISENATTRPERLLSRLKLNNSIDESVPRLIVIRSPKGPDGKGFSSAYRQPRLVGSYYINFNHQFQLQIKGGTHF